MELEFIGWANPPDPCTFLDAEDYTVFLFLENESPAQDADVFGVDLC